MKHKAIVYWTPERIDLLKSLVEQKTPNEKIALAMKISVSTIYKRLSILGIKKPRQDRQYSKIEGVVEKQLMQMLAAGKVLCEMAVSLGISKTKISTYFYAKGIDYCEQKELLSRQGKWPAGLKFEDCVPSKSDGHGKAPVPTYAGSLMGCSAAACAGR